MPGPFLFFLHHDSTLCCLYNYDAELSFSQKKMFLFEYLRRFALQQIFE